MRGHYQHAIRGTQSLPGDFDAKPQHMLHSVTAAEMLYNPGPVFYVINFMGLSQFDANRPLTLQ
jgi:hypothetical protein